jgi:hypothetical protein
MALLTASAVGLPTATARALNTAPPAFVSLPGSYLVDADALVMSGPDGFLQTGTLENDRATFRFSDFLLGTNSGIVTEGARPVAIFSLSDMIIGGQGIVARSAGFAGGAPTQPGAGPGGGSSASTGSGGGGGYAGPGGAADTGGAGGGTYGGDLKTDFCGGSGGGGSEFRNSVANGTSGAAGGGAIELGAMEQMIIAGAGVRADGAGGGSANSFEAGGGGSGGAVYIHAPEIVNTSFITANGGRGGSATFGNGGGGGGGRLLIETLPGGLIDLGIISAEGGAGGSSFFGTAQPGGAGQVTINIVPEPAAWWLSCAGSLALISYRRRFR